MKKYFLKPFTLKLTTLFALLLAIIIIHSCKKDNKSTQLTDPVVAQAKVWYENTYPVSNAKSKLVTQSISHDLSQWVKPDWQHNASYTRLGKNVIEMPIDPSSKFGSTLKIGNAILNKTYSRSYFLLMNDGKNYEAYILTILADSGYVNNDPSKLAHNTYRKLDADFSGKLLYFTPRGAYLGGYGYKNGQLVAPPAATNQQTGGQHIQSVSTDKLTPDNMVQECTDWYIAYFTDGVFQYAEYLTTTCKSVDDGNGGGGGSSTASPPPPPPCPAGSHPGPPVTPPCIPLAVDAINGGHLIVNNIPPPPPTDGGAPPPPAQTSCSVDGKAKPCPVDNADITDSVKNACLRNMVEATIGASMTNQINSLIQSVFGGSQTTMNIKFVDVSTLSNGIDAYTNINGGIVNGKLNIEIQLNANTLPYYSQQYIAETIMHEALHAYLTAKGTAGALQHQTMAISYVANLATSLQQMFPGMSAPDAKNLSLGGLQGTTAFKDSIATSMVLSGSFDATNLAYSIGPTGIRCTN